ncbi:MAG: DUF1569 domain-containing protein [Phycisphaerales bacterium]
MAVHTGKVTDRRELSFGTLADAVADAERIACAEKAGTLRRSGNWTAGQAINHVAAFMEYPFDGYPREMSAPPWIVRVLVKPLKSRYLRRLPAGVRVPGVPGGTVGAEDGPVDAAVARLAQAARRLQATAPQAPNPVFGTMTHGEWLQINCRHAELHFSFLHP